MASSNAGPITGRERIRILQGGFDVWVDRPQFTSILALASQANAGPRPYTSPTTILGTETFSAWQDGTKITLNAADITTFLAGSGNAPAHPDPNLLTTPSGNELIMGHQSGFRVAWSIAETLAIQATAGPVLYPVNTVAPTITGTPQVGSVLTSSQGTWTNSPTAYAYQWKAAGSNVGTNANTYTPVTGDVGKVITVTVTATNANPGQGVATSAPTSAVIAAAGLATRKLALFVGDSTTEGVQGDATNVRSSSYPSQIVTYFTGVGIPAIAASMAADNNASNGSFDTATWEPYRGDMSHTTVSMQSAASSPTMGGTQLRFASTQNNVFTSTDVFDTMVMFQPKIPSGGTLKVVVDGGTPVTYTGVNTPLVMVKNTLSGLARTTHAVTFSNNDGTSVYTPIFYCYDSTIQSIAILNAGVRNWTTTNWTDATNPAANNPISVVQFVAADLVCINLGINDYRQAGTSIATFKTNMQAIINAAVAGNAAVKIILVVPTPISTYNTTTSAWSAAAVLQAYQDLQAANAGSALVDVPLAIFQAGYGTDPGSTVGARVNTWASLQATYYAGNALHPNTVIYGVEANAVGAAIKTALGL